MVVTCGHLPTYLPTISMNAYHVLAKVTGKDVSDTRHFFVKAPTEGRAVTIAQAGVLCATGDESELQFTVKKARSIESPSLEGKGEELFAL